MKSCPRSLFVGAQHAVPNAQAKKNRAGRLALLNKEPHFEDRRHRRIWILGPIYRGPLSASGHEVITLTNSTRRPNPFGERIQVLPFNFQDPQKLRDSLQGVEVLINTYWVRFDHRLFTHGQAVSNTRILFDAAKAAGVRRIVHVSITNPDASSPLPYFRGKAELESALMDSGISYCILRPTVLFGKEDVLINNIAWSLRHLPVFGVFGAGDYRLQPIHVDDLAQAAVAQAEGTGNRIIEAIGPETFTYRELAMRVREALGLRRPIVSVPPAFGYWVAAWSGGSSEMW